MLVGFFVFQLERYMDDEMDAFFKTNILSLAIYQLGEKLRDILRLWRIFLWLHLCESFWVSAVACLNLILVV